MNKFLFFISKSEFNKCPINMLQMAELVVYYVHDFQETPFYVAKTRNTKPQIFVTRHEMEGLLWNVLCNQYDNITASKQYHIILSQIDKEIYGYIYPPYDPSTLISDSLRPKGASEVTKVVRKIKEKLDNMSEPIRKDIAFEQKCQEIWLEAVFLASTLNFPVPKMKPFTYADTVVKEFRERFGK